MGQHRDEDLHIGLAAPGAQRQCLAREVRQAPQPRLVVEAHLRLAALTVEAFGEQGAEAAVAVRCRALRPGFVAVLDPELAPCHAGAPALALAAQLREYGLPVGLHAYGIARHARIQPRTKRLIVETIRQRPGQPRRRRPLENVRDRTGAHAHRGRGLRPRQAEPVAVLKNLLDAHCANPPHRAPASSNRSSDRSGRVGRESAPRLTSRRSPSRTSGRRWTRAPTRRSNHAGIAVKCVGITVKCRRNRRQMS